MKAFPTNVTKSSGGDGWKTDYGMDLRDYFAGQAISGLLTAELVGEYTNEHVAEISYVIADAMMKAREK